MNKIFSMIGLATRAGKTVAGEFSVEKAVKDQKAKLVIVSEEASDNTKKLFTNKCTYYRVPFFVYGSREELGNATGNKDRVSIAVLDSGFSKSIINMLTDNK
ncbi:MAG: L7Ae/L30e/S12e/Gadd45 family ribosomal protein [Eubacterium sp.]